MQDWIYEKYMEIHLEDSNETILTFANQVGHHTCQWKVKEIWVKTKAFSATSAKTNTQIVSGYTLGPF